MDPSARRAEAFAADRQQRLRRRFRLRGTLGRMLGDIELAEPAPVAEIVAAQAVLRVAFPRDYFDFLRASNGGFGKVGSSFLELWPVHSLRERNQRLGLEAGLVAFGNGSPSEVFAFQNGMVLRLPERVSRGRSFTEFLESLAGS